MCSSESKRWSNAFRCKHSKAVLRTRPSASGLPAQTSVHPEVDVTRGPKVGPAGACPSEDPQSILRQERSLPLDLDELEQRLEAAFLSISGFHSNEPCVWACACFLVDGSPS